MTTDRDYVLGTHDEELRRLGLQHRVWRTHALRGWLDAGFTAGQTIADVGCGPGYATADLADIVGDRGRVIAVDRSRRFLDALHTRGLANVETFEADLDRDALPDVQVDGVWVRWVFAFVRRPDTLVQRVARLLKPGGTIVIHEYFDYSTWRFAPRSERFEAVVATVMESWRADGGEPDIALDLPRWLADEGLEIVRTRPIIDAISPSSYIWQWPATFVDVGLARLVELGRMTADDAAAVKLDFATRATDGRTLMITPAVLEIIARRP